MVTSGTHCPWVGQAVALALVDAAYKEPGTPLQVDVRGRRVDAQVVSLRNGTVADCNGCEFRTCLHFGEEGRCFYGGVIVDQVYPAIGHADGVLWLCPNYNDALAANLTACINRLTALFQSLAAQVL